MKIETKIARLLALVMGLALLALAACTKSAAPSSSAAPSAPPESPMPPLSISPPSQSQSAAESKPVAAAPKAKVLALGDTKLDFSSEIQVATQSELEKWNELIGAGTVAGLEVCNMNDAESELSADSSGAILAALMDADLRLYHTLGNPITGGSVHVIASDSSGSKLLHAVYFGEWFTVVFGNEDVGYVFDGAGTSLDDISAEIPASSVKPIPPKEEG